MNINLLLHVVFTVLLLTLHGYGAHKQWHRRHRQPVKKSQPRLTQLTLVNTTLATAWYGIAIPEPIMSCYVQWLVWLVFFSFAIDFIIVRSIAYFVAFAITEARVRETMLKPQVLVYSWIDRYHLMIRFRVLPSICVILFWIMFIPQFLILYGIREEEDIPFSGATESECVSNDRLGMGVPVCILASGLIYMLLVTVNIRRERQDYDISTSSILIFCTTVWMSVGGFLPLEWTFTEPIYLKAAIFAYFPSMVNIWYFMVYLPNQCVPDYASLQSMPSSMKIPSSAGGSEIEFFLEFISHNTNYDAFLQFVRNELSAENLIFYRLICEFEDDFPHLDQEQIHDRVLYLYQHFISRRGSSCVNISSRVLAELIPILENCDLTQCSPELFEPAKKAIIKLMAFDTFQRFKFTTMYEELHREARLAQARHSGAVMLGLE